MQKHLITKKCTTKYAIHINIIMFNSFTERLFCSTVRLMYLSQIYLQNFEKILTHPSIIKTFFIKLTFEIKIHPKMFNFFPSPALANVPLPFTLPASIPKNSAFRLVCHQQDDRIQTFIITRQCIFCFLPSTNKRIAAHCALFFFFSFACSFVPQYLV